MSIVYIDLGAKDGDTVRQFLSSRPMIQKVYAFEPAAYPEAWEAVKDQYAPRPIEFLQKAAWIEDGPITFVKADYHVESNTIMPGCEHYEKGVKETVEGVDFALWLDRAVSADDVVIVKMDIEGAEYDILDRLITTEIINLIDELYVEFHDWIMPAEYAERQQTIRARCPITIGGWG